MDKVTQLLELKRLFDNGLLTEDEFIKAKRKLLSNQDIGESKINVAFENNEQGTLVEDSSQIDNDHFHSHLPNNGELDNDQISIKAATSPWRYILAIVFFISGGYYVAYKIYFQEKWAQEIIENQNLDENSHGTKFTYLTEPVDDLESYSVTDITSEQELYAYLDEVAVFWCSEWKKAKEFKNENRRFEEMLKVDRCINAYPLGFQEGIIMLNDLPMALCSKAREHFQNKVIELGYEPNWDDESSEITSSLEEQIEAHERGGSSEYDEAEYNRQQEQAEYESSQAYYNSVNENSSKTYKDQSGNSFKSVKIGNQSWMGTNLNVDKFRNGDPIPQAKTAEEWVKAGENRQPAWCFYNNDPSNGKKYGKLYNQYAVNDPRGLAPIGWHIPKEAEWKMLVDYHGGRQNAGKKMKGTSGWSNSGNGNNEFEFNVLASGVRSVTGQFHYINEKTNFWCSTNNSYTNPHLILQNFSIGIYDGNGQPNSAFSVRCIKD